MIIIPKILENSILKQWKMHNYVEDYQKYVKVHFYEMLMLELIFHDLKR